MLIMNNELLSTSSISLDSLETEYKRKSSKQKPSDEHVDTILVPLYEKDVLIKVPKRKQKHIKCNRNNKAKKETPSEPINYLVNKDPKIRKTSYLELFRKQFTPNCTEAQNKKVNNEIRSISPEYGDTERESIGCESHDPSNDFYNTEPYNEIYYDKLLKSELQQYLEQSFEELLHFDEDITKCRDDNGNNLRSISEVSQPRRRIQHKISPPIQNLRLGGLGPDMENIKPRLERARSLQRYSEKVRMENRLKIYKKDIEHDRIERGVSATRHDPIKKQTKEQICDIKQSSYLVNKTEKEKSTLFKKIYQSKSKSADLQKLREREKVKDKSVKNATDRNKKDKKSFENLTIEVASNNEKSARHVITEHYGNRSSRVKSSAKTREINIETKENTSISPVQISFLVNVGGVRPSSALRTLEEKHRMYQEKVKTYCPDFKNL